MRDYHNHHCDCSQREMTNCGCCRDACSSNSYSCGYGGHNSCNMNKRHHHPHPHSHHRDCSHGKMSNCGCCRDACSSNSYSCGYGDNVDKGDINKKGARFLLEKAFYKALMEAQVERIKDILLDDEEMDETLEKTANLIIKIMKKQLQEGISKSGASEELDRELEKIFRGKKWKKEYAEEEDEEEDAEEEDEEEDAEEEDEEEDAEEEDEEEKRL
jgi:hypothetical protein